MLAAAMFHARLARLQEKFRIHARANWTHGAPLKSFVHCSGVTPIAAKQQSNFSAKNVLILTGMHVII